MISDEELEAEALAADPDAPVADDAVPWATAVGGADDDLLPDWYMPAPDGGATAPAVAPPGERRPDRARSC